MFNSTADAFTQGLVIYDMNKLEFLYRFTAGGTAQYEQSRTISQFYDAGYVCVMAPY